MRVSLFFVLFLLGCSHKVFIISPLKDSPRLLHEAYSANNMVTTQGEASSKAALEIFEKGGNIIDAFVAASFAISVERPQSTGLGGGGFLLYYSQKDRKVYAFDFREAAPIKSRAAMFLDKSGEVRPLLSQDGVLAVATPGLVAGLYEVHQRYGKLKWSELLAPAIRLAREGFPLYEHLRVALIDRAKVLKQDPEASRIFFTKLGGVPELGTVIVQENLARSLERIARLGKDGFYKGKLARAIVSTVKRKKGILRMHDLRSYTVKERTPVTGNYREFQIFSMPPPSSGGIHVIQILKMLEPYRLNSIGPQTAQATHLTALSMQRVFQDRALYLGDPDFHSVPVKALLDEGYLKKLSLSLDVEKVPRADELTPMKLPYESSETTHFTIADKEGNLIASTQTINGWFGSGVIARGTGIILNNEMDDFAQKVGASNLFGAVGGENNLVAPLKRPLSSMSPTIVLKQDRPYLALGSPSGTRIINCVAQTLLNTLEYKMPLYEAVAATRIHQQWRPDELKIEEPYLSEEVEKSLKEKGHRIVHGKLGCSIQAIMKKRASWIGVSDPRGEGLAVGN